MHVSEHMEAGDKRGIFLGLRAFEEWWQHLLITCQKSCRPFPFKCDHFFSYSQGFFFEAFFFSKGKKINKYLFGGKNAEIM